MLEEDTLVLPESAVINEYLEERYPEPVLLPADPSARCARATCGPAVRRGVGDDYYAFRRGEAGARSRFETRLDELDRSLAERPFLSGADYGLADIAYFPWLFLAGQAYLGLSPLRPIRRRGIGSRRLAERPAIARGARRRRRAVRMKIAFLHALPFDERMWEPQLSGSTALAPTLYALGASFDEWARRRARSSCRATFVARRRVDGRLHARAAIARLAPERLARARARRLARRTPTRPSGAPLRERVDPRSRAQRAARASGRRAAKNFFAPGTPDGGRRAGARGSPLEQDPEGLVARGRRRSATAPDSTEAVTSGLAAARSSPASRIR